MQAIFEMLGDDLSEYELLAEVLGSNPEARLTTASGGEEGNASD
jgi:hypothetical protein